MTISCENNRKLKIEKKSNNLNEDNNPINVEKNINSMLEQSEYSGFFWSTKDLKDKAMVLWDLDQGSWNKSRFNKWILGVESIISDKFNINSCCHFGAMNCNVPSRNNWKKLFTTYKNNRKKGWVVFDKNFKLEVVKCKKQAVDQRLINFSKEIMIKKDKPKLIVIISHDNDMIPIINLANSKNINNLVIRWRNIRPNCKIEQVAKNSIRVDKDSCYEI